MSHETAESISNYCDYFRRQLAEVGQMQKLLYSKILLVTILDTLARGRFPDQKNRERFTGIIREYSGWPDFDRVSPIQYHLYALKCKENKPTGEVSRHLEALFLKLNDAATKTPTQSITNDPTFAELSSLNPTPFEDDALRRCRFSDLMYAYRNKLVHEFKEPGYPHAFSDDEPEPYYFAWLPSESIPDDPPQLTFPRRWMLRVADSIIANLEKYYTANAIDPYSRHKFGSLWTE